MKKILVSEKKLPQLERAYRELKLASNRIYQSASGEKPFKISKLLNVMGKVLDDYEYIIGLLIGEREFKTLEELKKIFENSFSSPPLSIFLAYLEEMEAKQNE